MKQSLNRVLAILLLLFLAVLAGFLINTTLRDYHPKEDEPLTCFGEDVFIPWSDTVSLFSWNIGYAGLGAEMDFFYDGGEKVRAEESYFRECQAKIVGEIQGWQGADIILLQEVDKHARRSYFSDQVSTLGKSMPGYCSLFAINYKVNYVPVPLRGPMGKVLSGLVTLSATKPKTASRIPLPGSFGWPKNLFMPDRCLLVTRYDVSSGKELVVINVHNSAFDDTGKLRGKEMEKLKIMVEEEFGRGNYVIAGGDWNMNPPGFDTKAIGGDSVFSISHGVDSSFFADTGWQWVYDPRLPTNRDVSTRYTRGSTGTTLLDFFLVSPNVEVLEVKTSHLQFDASDHHPVRLRVVLSRDKAASEKQ